jgi:hypothetical protein
LRLHIAVTLLACKVGLGSRISQPLHDGSGNENIVEGFGDLTTVTMKTTVLYGVTPCSLVEIHRFGGTSIFRVVE